MSKSPEIEKLKTHPAVLRLYALRLGGSLQKEGYNYVARCPFHTENTPSFKIDTRPSARFLWRCFGGCNEGGDIIRFIEKIDRVESGAAIATVKKFIGGSATDWDRQRDRVEEVFQPAAEEVPKEYKTISLKDYYHRFEGNHDIALNWLVGKRGLRPETARSLHFGYVQSVGKMGGDVADQGWVSIPYIEGETVVYIKYRSIKEKRFCAQPGMRVTCFNLDTISTFDPVYVTEGEFDAAVLEQAGFSAVSLPSSSHSKDGPVVSPAIKDQLMLASKVILAGDTDQAGNAVMDRLWQDLKSSRLTWPEGMKDANQTFLEHCKSDVAAFRKLVEELTAAAPIGKHVYSAADTMRFTTRTNLADSPKRLRFPWKGVDEMAIITPGSVMSVFATNALANDTRVPTTVGFLALEEITVGASVFGENGQPVHVIAVFPKGVRQMFRITFSDGTFVRCDAEHLWKVHDRHRTQDGIDPYRVLETQAIRAVPKLRSGKSSRFYVPMCKKVQFLPTFRPLRPYIVGALLGDGSIKNYVRLACSDRKHEIVTRVQAELPRNHVIVQSLNDAAHWYIRNEQPRQPNRVREALLDLGLLGLGSREKFIPIRYLEDDWCHREALLQGLLDTDGSAAKNGTISYFSMSPRLAQDTATLVRSLGGYATVKPQKNAGFAVNIWVPDDVVPFSVLRKLKRWQLRLEKKRKHKNVVSITPDGSAPCTCLAVDNPTGLFLVNDYVVTHNTKMGKTTFMMNATLHGARFHGEVVLNYQVELSPDEYVGLMAAYLLQRNRNNLTHEDMMEACAIMTRENIQYYIGRNQSLTTVTPVLDLIEDAIQRYGITVVVLDHIHFICRNEKDEVQAQANAMQRIKNMAGTYKIKFIVVGQPRKATAANRGKMVHITDAKGSESFSSDADAVYAIHRDWIREKDPANPPMDDYNPETEVHMLGARFKGNGSTMQTLFFNGATATFREISGAQVPKIDGGQTGQLCYNGNGVE